MPPGLVAFVRTRELWQVCPQMSSERFPAPGDCSRIEHMFDHQAALAGPVDADQVRAWVTEIAQPHGQGDDRSRLDLIEALEELKCAAEGLQADPAMELDGSMRQRAADRGVPAARQGQGVGHEIALARRESPHHGQQHLGLAKALHSEMPHTKAALRAGKITEWRATIIVRETGCLSLGDRQAVDRRIAGDPRILAQMGDRELSDAVRRMAYSSTPRRGSHAGGSPRPSGE
jgi:hypothetical protein